MEISIITRSTGQHEVLTKDKICGFLHQHLDEFGDPIADIAKCYDYAFTTGYGGFAIVAHEGDKILGATIINETGMGGFIPENILVYIAVDAAARGKGVGKGLMQRAIDHATGDIALHVEPNNPAKFLYEKLGFTNKYLEMR